MISCTVRCDMIDKPEVGFLVFGARSQIGTRYASGRAMSLPPCDSPETGTSPPLLPVAAAFDPSEYTRCACQRAADGAANIDDAVFDGPVTWHRNCACAGTR